MMLQRLIVPISLSHQNRKQSIQPEPSHESEPIAEPQHMHTHDRKYFQESRDESTERESEATDRHKLQPSAVPKIVKFSEDEPFSFKGDQFEAIQSYDEEVIRIGDELLESEVEMQDERRNQLNQTSQELKNQKICHCPDQVIKMLLERQKQCAKFLQRMNRLQSNNMVFLQQQQKIHLRNQASFKFMTQPKKRRQTQPFEPICEQPEVVPPPQREKISNSKVQNLISRLQLRVS